MPAVILSSTYDNAGRRTELAAEVDTVDDFVNDYTYDALGRVTRIDQTDGAPASGYTITDKRVDIAYNDVGQFDTIARYEDLAATDLVAETTYVYNARGELTNLDHEKGMTSFADYGWTYDDAGRIPQFTSNDGTSDYTYDDAGQLTAVDHDYQTDESYSYDDTGNRTNTGYTTGDNNQLTSDGTYNYLYDDEGNRTKKTEISSGDYVEYEWDHRNRLTKVTFRDNTDAKTKEVAYTYDALDRLLVKQVDDDGNGSFDRAEKYVYDGSDVALVFDDSSSLTSRYLHGPAVDQVFAQEDSSGDILWALTDNQGTVRDVVDYNAGTDTTTVDNHIKYDAYGNITAESNSSVEFRYTYTGRFFDEDTDLQYNRARWYDATVGKWISEDPIQFAAGDPNINRYVTNSPTNFIDPSGLDGGPPGAATLPGVMRDSGAPVPERYRKAKYYFDESVKVKPSPKWSNTYTGTTRGEQREIEFRLAAEQSGMPKADIDRLLDTARSTEPTSPSKWKLWGSHNTCEKWAGDFYDNWQREHDRTPRDPNNRLPGIITHRFVTLVVPYGSQGNGASDNFLSWRMPTFTIATICDYSMSGEPGRNGSGAFVEPHIGHQETQTDVREHGFNQEHVVVEIKLRDGSIWWFDLGMIHAVGNGGDANDLQDCQFALKIGQ